jgi:CO/xanthine dehydrogenase FAD-binding subunit
LRPREFFVTYLSTAMRPNEMLVEVYLPASPPRSGWAFEEFSRRAGDFALVAIAALVASEGGRCRAARLAAAGGGPVPVRLEAAESILQESGLTDDGIDAAAEVAGELVAPDSDIHASAAYRRQLTRVLTRRALRRARERTENGHHE